MKRLFLGCCGPGAYKDSLVDHHDDDTATQRSSNRENSGLRGQSATGGLAVDRGARANVGEPVASNAPLGCASHGALQTKPYKHVSFCSHAQQAPVTRLPHISHMRWVTRSTPLPRVRHSHLHPCPVFDIRTRTSYQSPANTTAECARNGNTGQAPCGSHKLGGDGVCSGWGPGVAPKRSKRAVLWRPLPRLCLSPTKSALRCD